MRDFSGDPQALSLNTATVRAQDDLFAILEACALHGIRTVSPWRDQVAAVGLDRTARALRDAGLDLSGYCRGGAAEVEIFSRYWCSRPLDEVLATCLVRHRALV